MLKILSRNKIVVLSGLFIACSSVVVGQRNVPSRPTIGTPAQIQRRGHVNNMCEAQVMLQQLIRQKGGQRVSGDYRVVYLMDPPKGWYTLSGGRLNWRAPVSGENVHMEAAIFDSLTGKMLPMIPTLEIINRQGSGVQSKQLTYLWHPMVDHYGANFSVPAAGSYTIRIRASAPNILRHDKRLGDRFTAPVDVEFRNVRITPRRPPAAEM